MATNVLGLVFMWTAIEEIFFRPDPTSLAEDGGWGAGGDASRGPFGGAKLSNDDDGAFAAEAEAYHRRHRVSAPRKHRSPLGAPWLIGCFAF